MDTMTETTRMGRRGTIVIPAALRRRVGLEEGTLVVAEVRDDGILLRPAVALPIEMYTPERKAEFLLNTATDKRDYQRAVAAVRELGVDPATVPHKRR